jgi:hypothetical protein
MTIRRTFPRLSAALVIACSAASLSAQAPLVLVPVRVDQVMSEAQQRQTGVYRLTPEQRIKLDGWLTRYSAELTRAVGATLAQPTAAPRDRQWVPLIFPPGAQVVDTPQDGTYVRLADGTLWEVYLPDRTTTVTWHTGDYVTVSRAGAAMGEYDHQLVDAPARTRAFARFVGLVSPRRR